MCEWIAVQQNSDPWLKSKVGMLSSSRYRYAVSYTKNGEETAERRKWKVRIALERIKDQITNIPQTKAMEWGVLYESEARNKFEQRTGMIVQICGIAMHDTLEWTASSPDGLISDDTVWEAKCPQSETHAEYILAGVVPKEYIPQLLHQCFVTGRTRAIFTSYDPTVPEPMDLFIREYVPTVEELAECERECQKFLAETEEIFEKLTQSEF